MLPLKKILCPTDFSDPSFRALEVANEFASQYHSEVLLQHVVNPPSVLPSPDAAVVPNTRFLGEEMVSWAQESIDSARSKRIPETVRSRGLVSRGDPAEEIVRSAEHENVDLIVIATHARKGLRRFLAGSVTEKVARLSEKPVLVVHMSEKRDDQLHQA